MTSDVIGIRSDVFKTLVSKTDTEKILKTIGQPKREYLLGWISDMVSKDRFSYLEVLNNLGWKFSTVSLYTGKDEETQEYDRYGHPKPMGRLTLFGIREKGYIVASKGKTQVVIKDSIYEPEIIEEKDDIVDFFKRVKESEKILESNKEKVVEEFIESLETVSGSIPSYLKPEIEQLPEKCSDLWLSLDTANETAGLILRYDKLGKVTKGITAGAFYLGSILSSTKEFSNRRTQKEVAGVYDLSITTVRNGYKKIVEDLNIPNSWLQ